MERENYEERQARFVLKHDFSGIDYGLASHVHFRVAPALNGPTLY